MFVVGILWKYLELREKVGHIMVDKVSCVGGGCALRTGWGVKSLALIPKGAFVCE